MSEQNHTLLSTDKLTALMDASDEMMRSILRHDEKTTLSTLVRRIHDLLEAEACSIFLVPDDAPHFLELAAVCTDKKDHIAEALRLSIHNDPRGGITGYIAYTGEVTRLNSRQIRQNPYFAGKPSVHVPSGTTHSLLGIPLKNRRGRLLGTVNVENKKGSDGLPGEVIEFGVDDEAIARILANKIVVVLESLRERDILHGLFKALHASRTLDGILDDIANMSLRLLDGDRGDLFVWSEAEQDLILRAKCGSHERGADEHAANPSIVRLVWETGTSFLNSSVRDHPNYHEGHPETRSEVAVRLEFEGQPLGVLNVESFQTNAFDTHDLELLHSLAGHAGVAVKLVGREARFRGIVESVVDYSASRKDVLTDILESVRDMFGFSNGIVYFPDYEKEELRGLAFIGYDGPEFTYRFDERALAAKVLHTRDAYYSPDPYNDPEVNPRELKHFGIRGPILGVPLVSPGHGIIGILVVWSHREPHPTQEHANLLQPFARLAAATIAFSESGYQLAGVMRTIQEFFARMQTARSSAEIFSVILKAVIIAGFDRARIYELSEDRKRFLGLVSTGMDDPESFKGFAIDISSDPYARDTLETGPSEPIARIYDPVRSGFGPDRDAGALGKPEDLPWAVVPLVLAGQLYGKIVGDNARTKRPISELSLGHLNIIGALAMQAIAFQQTLDMLREQARVDEARKNIHRINTPAVCARNYVETLIDKLKSLSPIPREAMDIAISIRGQVTRLASVSRRMQRGQLPLKTRLRVVEINELVRRAVLQSKPEYDRQVEFDLCGTNPHLRVDSQAIDEAITALAANAWEAMKEDGILHVKTHICSPAEVVRLKGKGEELFVLISIRDEGSGVPEDLAQLLKQGGVPPSKRGLGLRDAKMTTAEHCGELWLERTGPSGSEFILALPLRSSSEVS